MKATKPPSCPKSSSGTTDYGFLDFPASAGTLLYPSLMDFCPLPRCPRFTKATDGVEGLGGHLRCLKDFSFGISMVFPRALGFL